METKLTLKVLKDAQALLDNTEVKTRWGQCYDCGEIMELEKLSLHIHNKCNKKVN